MAERLHRTEILLEPEQHQKLADLAEREGRSLSAVVRGILKEELKRHEPDRRSGPTEPVASLLRSHAEMRARRGGLPVAVDVEALIRDMRDERDEEILAGLLVLDASFSQLTMTGQGFPTAGTDETWRLLRIRNLGMPPQLSMTLEGPF